MKPSDLYKVMAPPVGVEVDHPGFCLIPEPGQQRVHCGTRAAGGIRACSFMADCTLCDVHGWTTGESAAWLEETLAATLLTAE